MSTFGDILYESVDGAFAIDANQRIIYWDPGCEELLGYSENWVLGRNCCDVIDGHCPGSDKRFCQSDCPVAKLGEGSNGAKSFRINVKDHDQQTIPLSVNIILVPSGCHHKSWHAMHLLHRSTYPDVLNAFERSKPHANTKVSQSVSQDPLHDKGSRLTRRENEILQYLAEGLSSPKIAKKLNISTTTVRNHVQHLQAKLGVHSQTEAVAYAYRHHYL